jgi:hypothetical protein
MIASAAVNGRSVRVLSCMFERRRPCADHCERRQLQPQLQPRRRAVPHRAPTRPVETSCPPVTFEAFAVVRGRAVCAGHKAVTSAVVRPGTGSSGPRCCTGCCTTPPRSGASRSRPCQTNARGQRCQEPRLSEPRARRLVHRCSHNPHVARHALGPLRMTGIRPVPLAPCGTRFLAPSLDHRSCRPGSLVLQPHLRAPFSGCVVAAAGACLMSAAPS